MTRAPFPWFGGKRRVADLVWRAFGPDVPNSPREAIERRSRHAELRGRGVSGDSASDRFDGRRERHRITRWRSPRPLRLALRTPPALASRTHEVVNDRGLELGQVLREMRCDGEKFEILEHVSKLVAVSVVDDAAAWDRTVRRLPHDVRAQLPFARFGHLYEGALVLRSSEATNANRADGAPVRRFSHRSKLGIPARFSTWRSRS